MRSTTREPSTVERLHRNDLPLGGFAGLKEHRLVMSSAVWGRTAENSAWEGIDRFVYLADATFDPHGETGMHPHREIDVISVMAKGRIRHHGTLEDGAEILAPEVQVQRAGAEGFLHNEINPDPKENRMIQMWVLPDRPGHSAGYCHYSPARGSIQRVYGGNETDVAFASSTIVDVALLDDQQLVKFDGSFIAYLVNGSAVANGQAINEGDLIRGENLEVIGGEACQLIVVHLGPQP